MIKVQIPGNNLPEREYVIKVLLSDLLGVQYTLEASDSYNDYSINTGDKELIIKDGFFKDYKNDLTYLNKSSIPGKILFAKNKFIVEKDIPVIYGTDEIVVSDNKLICGIDIFASSFFMLTRWEEYVIKSRDIHGRFSEEKSLAVKNDILHRPVVNEYVEMLWNMFVRSGYKGKRKERNFELTLTHDVDALTLVSNKTILGDILKRKNINLATKNFKFLIGKDPFDTYDLLMTISEKLGVRSHFYFMSTDSGKQNDTSWYVKRRKFKSLIKQIKDRGHIIGFHPGYYTFDDAERWRYEKKILEDAIRQKVTEGRQHFLRLNMPKTFGIWEKNDMEIDSSLGYANNEGFRCGTGDTFPVFDFLERKELRLKERPLVIMDGMLLQGQHYTPDKAKEVLHEYIALGRKYKTGITLLFHNSSFYGEWEGYDEVYKELLNIGG